MLRALVERARRPPDARASAQSSDAIMQPTGRRPIHWLLEGVFIVLSVVLGFGISEFGESRDERELAVRMLASIRTEVEYNRGALAPYIPIHRKWHQALGSEDPSSGTGSAIDVLFATRPQLPADITVNIPLLRHAAWDTALSTGTLRLIGYDLAAALSEIYGMQEYAGASFSRLFSDPSVFDPSRRSATIRWTQTMMQEMTWAEETLLALYDKYLPSLRAAAGDQ
jgi:hypothetical protein